MRYGRLSSFAMCRSGVSWSWSEPGITGIEGFVGFNGSWLGLLSEPLIALIPYRGTGQVYVMGFDWGVLSFRAQGGI